MAEPTYYCVLFDLDGTLAHTAGDMLAALNYVLEREDRPHLPMSEVRGQVSHGSAALIKIAFGADQTEPDFERRKAQFLDRYQNNLCHYTRLFPGFSRVLRTIEMTGGRWGIVTNKPGWLTDPLVYELELDERAACVISGDSTEQRKPHPLPLLTAAKQAGIAPEQCIYVGDAQRDIEAGNAAGMLTLIANWGYIDDQQQPETWGADGRIDDPYEVLNWYSEQP